MFLILHVVITIRPASLAAEVSCAPEDSLRAFSGE